MKVTFICHSGYCIELEDCVLLFDYCQGEIPDIPGKRWYVFVSHFHQDHFNPVIAELCEKYETVWYILSDEIRHHRREDLKKIFEKKGMGSASGCLNDRVAGGLSRIGIYVKPRERYEIGNLIVHTFRSTDEGCAFLVQHGDQLIYHAGDLNWWHWDGDPKVENDRREREYKEEIARVKEACLKLVKEQWDRKNRPVPSQEGILMADVLAEAEADVRWAAEVESGRIREECMIDAAMMLLDPRQKDAYRWAMDYMIAELAVRHVFPMHMWRRYKLSEEYAASLEDPAQKEAFHPVHHEGESWEID